MSLLSEFVGGKTSNPYQAPDLSFLKNPPNYSDYYNSLTALYNPLMGARTKNAQDQLASLSSQIDTNTNAAEGSATGGYARRGLIDPNAGGVTSDIASVGLADIAAKGAQQKNQLGLQFEQNQLDLLGSLLGTSVNQANTDQQNYAQDLLTMAGDRAKSTNYVPGALNYAAQGFGKGFGQEAGSGLESFLFS